MASIISGQNGKRLEWADTAKGIGIILVILAHTSLDYTWLGKFINSFHMPLFFFLSGYFFFIEKYNHFTAFLHKKAMTLLLPYMVFALGSFMYFIVRYSFGDPNYYKDLEIYQQFLGIFYSAGIRTWMDFNLPLWFLTCLFTVEVMFYALRRFFTSGRSIAAILLCSSLAGYLDGLWNPVKLPWGIDVALTAVVFFGAGHLLRARFQSLLSKPIPVRLALAALLLAVNIAFIDQRVNLNMKVHGHYYDFYIAAFAGVTWCLLLSSVIGSSKVLNYVGHNALILMALHMPLLNVASKIMHPFGTVTGPYTVEVLRTVITVLLAIPVIYIINRYTPYLLGKGIKTSVSNTNGSAVFKVSKL